MADADVKLTTVSKGGADMGTVVPADALSKTDGKVLAGNRGARKTACSSFPIWEGIKQAANVEVAGIFEGFPLTIVHCFGW